MCQRSGGVVAVSYGSRNGHGNVQSGRYGCAAQSGPDQTWVTAIGVIGAHSVVLKGAIVETTYIPADF